MAERLWNPEPNIKRVVRDRVGYGIDAYRDDLRRGFAEIHRRFDRLEGEYRSISAALKRIEEMHQRKH